MKKLYTICFIFLSTSVLKAQQAEMRLDNITIKISDTIKVKVDGDFQLLTTAQIDNDGFVEINGDFINNGISDGFINRNNKGKLLLKRTNTPILISGSTPLYFEKLALDNPQGIDVDIDIFIDNELELVNGKIFSPNDFVTFLNNNTIIGANNNRYIAGKMRQYVTNSQTYHFPIGTPNDYTPTTLSIHNTGTSNFVEAEFMDEIITSPTLVLNNTNITTFLNSGFWRFNNSAPSEVFFDITTTSNGHTNGGSTTTQHALFRRTNGTWENAGTHNNATQSGSLNNAITAKRIDVQGLGDFIIGRGTYTIETNAVLNGNFKFINAFQLGSELNIEFIGLENHDYEVRLIDLNGRLIETKRVNNFSTSKHVNFDITNLRTHIYLITISTTDFLFTKKILIN